MRSLNMLSAASIRNRMWSFPSITYSFYGVVCVSLKEIERVEYVGHLMD